MDQSFYQAIAQQIALLANISEAQAIQCVEEPKNLAKADLAVVVAKINKFTKLYGNPAKIAEEWKSKITPNKWIKSASNEGPYLNFIVNKAVMVEQVLKQVFAAQDKWGYTNVGENKTIVVEYSSPNIAKPFHAGHLRSTIIGNFIKNLHQMLGYKTVSINYLGDWGKQYGLLAIGFEKYGNEEKLKEDPIRHLFDVYVQINKDVKLEDEDKDKEDKILQAKLVDDAARAYFKRMENGDESALSMWKRFKDLSIHEYKNTYKRLNVSFDVFSGESQQSEGMFRAMDELKNNNLLTEDKGALLIDLEKYGLHKTLVQKSDGATLYITRDIAAATSRFEEYNFHKMIYVVGTQQDLHFQQLFKVLHLMGKEFAPLCQHINFGMVLGMSTRNGKVVFLADILNKAKRKMLKVMKENGKKYSEIEDPEATADIIGLSAVVIQDLSAKRIKDYAFNWKRIFNFEGDTGAYLQFQHARMCSMERKSGVSVIHDIDFSLLSEPAAHDIVRMIGRFPNVVLQAGSTLEPVTVVTYLFELAHVVSSAHNMLWVKNREIKLAEARLALFWAARITLGNGLKLLGLHPLERITDNIEEKVRILSMEKRSLKARNDKKQAF